MDLQLKKLQTQIDSLKLIKNPISVAWNLSCDNIDLEKENGWRGFGELFFNLPDLVFNKNAYHNQYHSAEAVLSASVLLNYEFEQIQRKLIGPFLLFSMLCHDVAHTGEHNNFNYELEQKAVNEISHYIEENRDILIYWKKNMQDVYGPWSLFFDTIKSIILGTDFKVGPLKNSKKYKLGNYKSQLKMLANEADILASCLSSLGPQRGALLALEQNDSKIGTWGGRCYFLKNLALYKSVSSQRLNINLHIKNQISVIDYYGAQHLDNLVKINGLDIVANAVASIVDCLDNNLSTKAQDYDFLLQLNNKKDKKIIL